MRSIRRFEEHLLELFETGLLNGTTHACIGQEAPTALRLWEHLDEEDHVFSNHRCHRQLPGANRRRGLTGQALVVGEDDEEITLRAG